MVDVLAIRVTTVVASVVLGKRYRRARVAGQ
jgi:hypothetical protein